MQSFRAAVMWHLSAAVCKPAAAVACALFAIRLRMAIVMHPLHLLLLFVRCCLQTRCVNACVQLQNDLLSSNHTAARIASGCAASLIFDGTAADYAWKMQGGFCLLCCITQQMSCSGIFDTSF